MSSTFKKTLLTALIVIVFTICLVFYLRNDQVITLDYILGSQELSFSLWLVIILALGIFLGWLTAIPAILRLKRDNAKLTRQVNITEKEINNLRVLPLKDDQ